MKNTAQKRLPYPYYFYPAFLLVLLGLGVSGYLVLIHYRNYTDIGFSSFCAISKTINCDTVSQSPWSILFNLPVAAWGFLNYLIYGVILFAARINNSERLALWNVLFLLGVLFAAASIYFGYVSAVKINSYCILCLFIYGINFSILLNSWITKRRFVTSSLLTGLKESFTLFMEDRYLKIAGAIIIVLFSLLYLRIPHYWTYSFPEKTSAVSTGITANGNPWIGAEEPLLTIEEYSDYQCFQCNKMHHILRQLINEYPDKIKLIHHHYPMDHEFNDIVVTDPFHVGSGKMALLAIYAFSKDKFWLMNDLLYELGKDKTPFNTKALAEKTGLKAGALAQAVNNKNIRNHLLRDIRRGLKYHITATPTFVIDGKTYVGSIPREILEKIME